MIALGGSLSFAFLMLITRSLRATPDIVLATSQFGGTFLLGALMSPIGWVTPTIGSLGLFSVAGVTSVAALLCINRSLKLAPASVVVPYQYSMIVWAVIFGFVVWGDVPSISTIIGAVIIIGAGFYIFLREQQLGRLEAVQFDAAPLEAAFLQDVARRRIGDTGARNQVLGIEFLEEEIDHRARGFGAETLAPMRDAEPVAEFRRLRRAAIDADHADG